MAALLDPPDAEEFMGVWNEKLRNTRMAQP
jgi:hypothetical protein